MMDASKTIVKALIGLIDLDIDSCAIFSHFAIHHVCKFYKRILDLSHSHAKPIEYDEKLLSRRHIRVYLEETKSESMAAGCIYDLS